MAAPKKLPTKAGITKPATRPAASKATTPSAPARFVALLRGLNVGGNNRLAMTDLAAVFAACGCSAVTTFIQSGNVIFEATAPVYDKLHVDVPARLRKAHGLDVPVVLRSRDELALVPKQNPYADRTLDDKLFNVLFLADAPTASAASGLDPERSPGDEYRLVGREIYLWLPNGVARSKLTNAYFDRALGTVTTGRNWRTIQKLIELSA